MGSLVKYKRCGNGGKKLQPFALFLVLARQKSLKEEFVHVKSRKCYGGNCGTRAGDCRYGDACLCAKLNEILTGIAYRGHTRIRYKRTAFAGKKETDDLFTSLGTVMLVIRNKLAVDAEAGKKLSRDTGILCGYYIDLGKHLARSVGYVGKIADRCADKV